VLSPRPDCPNVFRALNVTAPSLRYCSSVALTRGSSLKALEHEVGIRGNRVRRQ